MRIAPVLLAAVLAGSASQALAEEPATAFVGGSDARRLTPVQVEAVLAEAARKREAGEKAALAPAGGEQVRPPVRGEMGFAIGSGGFRSMFGSAAYPLGSNGVAAISLSLTDWGRRGFRH